VVLKQGGSDGGEKLAGGCVCLSRCVVCLYA
jgi:hypothetical protein